jgi:aminopeptidase N
LQSRLDLGAMAAAIFARAGNMTEQAAALACLLDAGQGQDQLAAFASRWAGDANVMDKWFSVQLAMAAPDQMAGLATSLAAHPQFSWKNPNRFRAVLGAVSAHHAGFHHASGAGYRFVADWLMRLDPVNPQTTARMSTAFETWPRYDAARQALIRGEIARMAAMPGLSRDLGEMLARIGGQDQD